MSTVIDPTQWVKSFTRQDGTAPGSLLCSQDGTTVRAYDHDAGTYTRIGSGLGFDGDIADMVEFNGELWVCTAQSLPGRQRLYKWTGSAWVEQAGSPWQTWPVQSAKNAHFAVFNSTLYVATRGGVYRRDADSVWTLLPFFTRSGGSFSPVPESATGLVATSTDLLYCALNVVWRYSDTLGGMQWWLGGGSNDGVMSLCAASGDVLYLGTLTTSTVSPLDSEPFFRITDANAATKFIPGHLVATTNGVDFSPFGETWPSGSPGFDYGQIMKPGWDQRVGEFGGPAVTDKPVQWGFDGGRFYVNARYWDEVPPPLINFQWTGPNVQWTGAAWDAVPAASEFTQPPGGYVTHGGVLFAYNAQHNVLTGDRVLWYDSSADTWKRLNGGNLSNAQLIRPVQSIWP